MKVRYQAEGTETAIEWSFRPGKLLNVEAEDIERRTGLTYDEWIEKLPPNKVSMLAIRGLLWVLLKRDAPTLRWEQVQFSLDELEFELELDEKREALEAGRNQLDAGLIDADKVDAVRNAIRELEAEISAADAAAGRPDEVVEGPEEQAPKESPALTFTPDGGQPSATPGDGIPATSTV